MIRTRSIAVAAALALGCLLVASLAQATVVDSGAKNFAEPNGFYTGTKSFVIYTYDDVANPAPGAPGELTYVYTITNDPGSFLAIIGFNIDAPVGSVVSAGWVTDANPATPPPAQVINNNDGVVRWDWVSPDVINPGQVSEQLYIISTYGPGSVTDTMYSIEGDFAFNLNDTCVGPFEPPEQVGEPLPCTIGFWKNRADGKNGTLQWFPDTPTAEYPNGQFQAVVDAAVALSSPLFATGDLNGTCDPEDFNDLICALKSKGKRTIEERARQQLAATYLNLAAGDLFPDNTKCKLFEGNQIGTNACGDALSVGTAVSTSTNAVLNAPEGDPTVHTAQECSDDINNGISLFQQ